ARLSRPARRQQAQPVAFLRGGGGDIRVHLLDRAGAPPARLPRLNAGQNTQPWLPATAPRTVISDKISATQCIRSIRAKSRAGSGDCFIRRCKNSGSMTNSIA